MMMTTMMMMGQPHTELSHTAVDFHIIMMPCIEGAGLYSLIISVD